MTELRRDSKPASRAWRKDVGRVQRRPADLCVTRRCLQCQTAQCTLVKTLEALQILPLLSVPPTLSWDVEASKPDRRIYLSACRACGFEAEKGQIMVGDELEASVSSNS